MPNLLVLPVPVAISVDERRVAALMRRVSLLRTVEQVEQVERLLDRMEADGPDGGPACRVTPARSA